MEEAEPVFVALGSNVGERELYLATARTALAALSGTEIIAMTDIEETEPIGPEGQDSYLNQMVVLRTTLEPEQLLRELQRIERENGRVRGERWGPRTLDLDIVRFGNRRLHSPALVLPHPELPNRSFWRRQLAQLANR